MADPTPLQDIALIVFDVDGVLTDGTLTIDAKGQESKAFNLKDGFAMARARGAGLEVGVLSGRADEATRVRMERLGVKHVIRGSKDKGKDVAALAEAAGVPLAKTAFVGDDVLDLPAMAACGLSMCPADAVIDVRQRADRVLEASGGRGAAREAIELILRAENKWDAIVQDILAAGSATPQ